MVEATRMNQPPVKRRNVRWKGGPKDVALIAFDVERTPMRADMIALVSDASYNGCGLIAIANEKLTLGAQVCVRVGPLDPLRAVVRWLRPVDGEIVRVGLEYQ